MSQPRASFNQDHEGIVNKFGRLVAKAQELAEHRQGFETEQIAAWFELRTSALNLFERTAGIGSIYYRALLDSHGEDQLTFTPGIMLGILKAALTDFREGFMADVKLLVSAEVFADFLVQAEVLLDHEYKDAAAVLIRAVLEDGMRKLCQANRVEAEKRDTIQQLNEKLYKAGIYSALHHKEVIAKAEIGNAAAHGRTSDYSREDVTAFLEFVLRFLAQYLK